MKKIVILMLKSSFNKPDVQCLIVLGDVHRNTFFFFKSKVSFILLPYTPLNQIVNCQFQKMSFKAFVCPNILRILIHSDILKIYKLI